MGPSCSVHRVTLFDVTRAKWILRCLKPQPSKLTPGSLDCEIDKSTTPSDDDCIFSMAAVAVDRAMNLDNGSHHLHPFFAQKKSGLLYRCCFGVAGVLTVEQGTSWDRKRHLILKSSRVRQRMKPNRETAQRSGRNGARSKKPMANKPYFRASGSSLK